MEYADSPTPPAASPRERLSVRPWAAPGGRSGRGFAAAALLAISLLILLAALVVERARHAEQARAHAGSAAKALAAHLHEVLVAADALLLAVQKEAASAASVPELRRALESGATADAALALRRAGAGPSLAVFDTGGAWIAGDADPSQRAPGLPQALRARSSSSPVPDAGPDSGSLQLVRAIRGRDAALLGGARVRVDARGLGRMVDAVASAPFAVAVRAEDGRWLSTWPAAAGTPEAGAILATAPVEGFGCDIVVLQAAGGALPAWWRGAAPILLANLLLVALASASLFWSGHRLARASREAGALREMASQAEASRRDMELLLAGMSRQLRSPLNAVCGLVDTLRRMPMPVEQARIVGVLGLSSEVLRGVADDLLDIAALESDAVKVERAPVNVRDFVDGVIASARAADGADRLLLDSEVASDVPIAVLADRGRLARILLHLLHNALRFTHRGAVALTVRRIGGDDRRAVVSFAVVDSGWGIPQEVRERLLQPPEERMSINDAGLAICSRMAVHLGGQLEAMSIDGLGSSVAISVPLETFEGDVPASGATPPKTEKAARPLRILVAEDVQSSQMVARLALEQLGHRVVVAADGAAAVKAFREASFDAILMDVQMPGVDGLEATRRIRASGLPGAERIPIIGLSALAADGEVEQAIASGMTAHVAKPVSIAALDTALAGIESRPQAAAASPAAAPERIAALDELARDLGAEMMFVATRQFRSDAEVLLSRLSLAQGAADRAGVQKAAHGLKGLFRQFGVPALAEVAASLDRNPAAGSPDAAHLVRRVLEGAPAALDGVLAYAEALSRTPR